MLEEKNINAYILAGGKSSRMGSDKGLMLVHNKSLIEYVITTIKPLTNRIYIVTDNDDYKKFNLELVPDSIKDIGPAGGIYSALQHCQTSHCVLLSCDMPFVNLKAIDFLIQLSNDFDITVPVFKGKLEPMLGVYSKNCLSSWGKLIQEKKYKLQEIFTNFNTQLLDVTNNSLFDDTFFMNVNSPEDRLVALKKIKDEH